MKNKITLPECVCVYNLRDHGVLVFFFELNLWVWPFSVHVFCNTFKEDRVESTGWIIFVCAS